MLPLKLLSFEWAKCNHPSYHWTDFWHNSWLGPKREDRELGNTNGENPRSSTYFSIRNTGCLGEHLSRILYIYKKCVSWGPW